MKLKLFLLAASLSAGTSVVSFAATTTGTINATLTLTTGCLVNGQPATIAGELRAANGGAAQPQPALAVMD
ncbi:hypothetical protein [[Erwinia] mediterraneensis]|uniref:hypothetical protein n=1 Tax=[Erwinia] mediterraneensis TaxID=2161819 RepID=UPI003F725CEF